MAKIPLEDINGSDEGYSILVTDAQGNLTYLDMPEKKTFISVGPEGFEFHDLDPLLNNSVLDDLRIIITSDNQTVFNLGNSETRTKLKLNGVEQDLNIDYKIELPLLTWIANYPLYTTDSLILSQ